MNTITKQDVEKWWYNGADYAEGSALFARCSHNKVLILQFQRLSDRYYDKLKYELTKAVGIDWTKMPKTAHRTAIVRTAPQKVTDVSKLPEPEDEPTSYPTVVRRIINEYSELYRSRSMLHQEMREVPEANDDGNCTKRSYLLEQIKKLTRRMDDLYQAREAYEDHKEMPNEAILWPREEPYETDDPLPNDIDLLKKMKINIQTSLSKDRNLLDYQNKISQEKKHPMPQGPKRKAIEMRIEKKLKRIEQIEYKILELK